MPDVPVTSPISILREAIRHVPSLKYALAVAGIAAAGSFVVQFVGHNQAGIVILSGVFIAMVLMYVFSHMVASPNPVTTLPGLILLYSVIIFFTIFLVFTVTAFAAYWPEPWARFLDVPPPQPGPVTSLPADQPAASETPASRVTSFRIVASIGNAPPAARSWKRIAPDRWSETYPSGNVIHFSVPAGPGGRITLNDCPGTTASDQSLSHRVFIPDKGCPGMPFYIRDGGQGWGFVSPMTEVQ